MTRSATWAEPNCRKLFRHDVSYFDPLTGSPCRRHFWSPELPANRKTRRTKKRERLMRIRLEDGSVRQIPCRVSIGPKTKGARVSALVIIGRRRVQVSASSLRIIWRTAMMAVERLMEREPDIKQLTDPPKRQPVDHSVDWSPPRPRRPGQPEIGEV